MYTNMQVGNLSLTKDTIFFNRTEAKLICLHASDYRQTISHGGGSKKGREKADTLPCLLHPRNSTLDTQFNGNFFYKAFPYPFPICF